MLRGAIAASACGIWPALISPSRIRPAKDGTMLARRPFEAPDSREKHLECAMKNLKTRLAVLLLSTPCLLTGAYGQITPSGDSYTNTAAPTTNYGANTLLDVESSQTTYIQFDLSSIPTGYTSADITKATLKLYVHAVTTAGSFNMDYVNGAWSE